MVTLNKEQGLYVIPCGGGYSCLGFDVAENKIHALEKWLSHRLLGHPCTVKKTRKGTVARYEYYSALCDISAKRYSETGERCTAELTPELVGLEGKRVEVVYPSGEKTRFIVGRSTGWLPCHLEIKTRRSHGGGAVYFPAGATVRAVA